MTMNRHMLPNSQQEAKKLSSISCDPVVADEEKTASEFLVSRAA